MFPKVDKKTSFPEIEEQILKFWKENKIFEKSVESRSKDKPYRFYDGPPFITGTPHYGTLLSSICKDIIPRYQTMQGKRVERVWGWDCHGLPIEDKVQKKLGLESNKDIEKVGMEKFIGECYNYTRDTSAEWEWYIEHIGRWVDFKNSYKTMDQDYMESVINVFKKLYEKGLIYKGQRSSLYSWKLSTPISNFEIAMDDSYEEVSDPAITVMFKLTSDASHTKKGDYILAWTTTPWTIPSHMAIAVNKEIAYSRVASDGKYFILATARVETVFKGHDYEIVDSFMGDKLVGLKYSAPFDYYKGKIDPEKNHIVYHADFVTDTDGTGIAHEAPEFGDVDFELAREVGIHITSALDNEGKYTSEINDLVGTHYLEANKIIPERLKEAGLLFKKESINHRVAMCPRTGTPLIYKVQDSWFIDIQRLKDRLVEENEGINWSPEHLKHGQFLKSMEGAPDWCISRTRYWGSPMPIWIGYNEKNEEKDMLVFGSIKDIEERSGKKVKDLHRPYIDEITWKENGLTYKRIPEVLDCWVESGSMPYAQMHYPFENKEAMGASFPADFIVEYIGQVRAWFYVMHVLGVALFDKRAFTNVITTGIVMGSDGRKMSKSYKNYPDPKETIETYGADAIRFYMANSPLLSGGNMNFSEDGVKEVIKKAILPLRNTYSFFTTYANIDKFEPKKGNLYFTRHAESETNAKHDGQGMSGAEDNPKLSDKGILQAKKAGEKAKLDGISFDLIVSSTLDRCKQTAQIIAENSSYKGDILVVEETKEQNYAEFEGKSHKEIAKDYNIDPNDKPALRRIYKNSKVENYIAFQERVEKAINKIIQENPGKNILFVGHAGTARVFMKKFLSLDLDYAHLDLSTTKNAQIIKFIGDGIENALDKWIVSELHKLINDVQNGLDNYKINEATRPIVRFMDNLTNWYIRRSRKRFWKSENDSDKIQAYETLYTVLLELSKIISPFMPFISEHIFKNLTGKESVHLGVFPESVGNFIQKGLNKDMDLTQKIINLGLAWRQNHKIRVRQPLKSITIGEKLDSYYIDIIKEELNVKEILLVDPASIAKKICKPNGRLIGPKFGKDVKFIISEAKAGNFEEIDGGKVKVGDFFLEGEEFEIAFEASEGDYEIEAGFGMVIAMDPSLDEKLIQEGIARDLVRYIQEARKEANFEVDDRISIEIKSQNSKLKEILENFGEYIEKETLSQITNSLENPDLKQDLEIEDIKIALSLKK